MATVFPFTADSVDDFKIFNLPARSTRTVANLYVQITGLAIFNVDPDWDNLMDPLAWNRGTLTFETPQPVLQLGDNLIESAVTAGFGAINREEEGSTDDFGIAVDSVNSVETASYGGAKPFGNLKIVLNAGYKGDGWVQSVSFTADLLIYRPALDNVQKSPLNLVDLLTKERYLNIGQG